MSLLKRKTFSLDPIEKQKKSRQVEYFILIDKCLQIPNDDKLILRKKVQCEDQCLICLLEKYRKQGSHDLKELQIYLRKIIQRYKADNPKYPTLKIRKGNQSCLSFNQRNSFSFSVSTSKLSYNPTNSNAQKLKSTQQNLQNLMANSRNQISLSKSKLTTPFKSERENYFGMVSKSFEKNSIKQPLKLNTSYCRDDEKNYEEMIKKRKTQKLKIEANRVSVTIQNQSFSPLNKFCSMKKENKFDEVKIRTENSFMNDSFMKVNDSLQVSKRPELGLNDEILECRDQSLKKLKVDEAINIFESNLLESAQKAEFLSTMSFKMKIDEPEQQIQKQINIESKCSSIKSAFQESENFIVINPSFNTINNQVHNQLKKKLFHSTDCLPYQQKQKLEEQLPQLMQKSLKQIHFQNIQLLSLKQKQKLNIKPKQPLKQSKRGKENFNSGQKSINNQQILKQTLNQSFLRSQVKSIANQNLSQLSTISKDNQQNNSLSSYYPGSHRITNQIPSQRFMEDSKAFMKSFIKERDQKSLKQSKSSRMQFSHRMEEIISGRTQKNEVQATTSFSNRDKIKGANKLAFWARIQSTINE